MFLNSVHRKLDAILEGVRRIMALSQQMTDLLAAIDIATNGIAARLASLAAARPDDPALVAALQAEVTKLQSLAADPANPVPEPQTPGVVVPVG